MPDSSAKALSKYSDLVDTLSREVLDKLAAATDAARLRLKEAELPDTLEALDAGSTAAVPDTLAAELCEVQSIGGVTHLRALLQVGPGGKRMLCCVLRIAAAWRCWHAACCALVSLQYPVPFLLHLPLTNHPHYRRRRGRSS